MHVKGFLHKLLRSVIPQYRIKVLSEVVLAAICTKQLRLTSLGRAINLPIQERSGIQKVNRLLGNKHLLNERTHIFQKIAALLVPENSCPIIIVDWSKYPNSNEGVLRASLSAKGRALTLYEECHVFKRMGNKTMHRKFLKSLADILPKNCKPIVVTDAGFHNFWFKDVLKRGWNYVGRIRNVKKFRPLNTKTYKQTRELFKKASITPQCLGKMQLTEKNPLDCYFYLMKQKIKGRKALMRNGKIKRDKDSKSYSKSHREPWLLVSSLGGKVAAKRVMRIYEQRMTIEEAFRDLKSTKYGFGLEDGRSRKKQRREVLLLIAMMASLIAWLTGQAGEKRKIQYQFQSNSIKTRRVLSLFYLGCQIIRKKVRIPISTIWETAGTICRQELNHA